MKINLNSMWMRSYEANRAGHFVGDNPTNLCDFVTRTMGVFLFRTVPLWTGVGMAIFAIVFPAIMALLIGVDGLMSLSVAPTGPFGVVGMFLFGFTVLMGTMVWCLAIAAAIAFTVLVVLAGITSGWMWAQNKWRDSRPLPRNTRRPLRQESILTAWIKAKRDKVCPLIEYE